jgi:hypothetical protein
MRIETALAASPSLWVSDSIRKMAQFLRAFNHGDRRLDIGDGQAGCGARNDDDRIFARVRVDIDKGGARRHIVFYDCGGYSIPRAQRPRHVSERVAA